MVYGVIERAVSALLSISAANPLQACLIAGVLSPGDQILSETKLQLMDCLMGVHVNMRVNHFALQMQYVNNELSDCEICATFSLTKIWNWIIGRILLRTNGYANIKLINVFINPTFPNTYIYWNYPYMSAKHLVIHGLYGLCVFHSKSHWKGSKSYICTLISRQRVV